MRAALMSIKPEWWEKILAGEKTMEIRKTAPQGGAGEPDPVSYTHLHGAGGNISDGKTVRDTYIISVLRAVRNGKNQRGHGPVSAGKRH